LLRNPANAAAPSSRSIPENIRKSSCLDFVKACSRRYRLRRLRLQLFAVPSLALVKENISAESEKRCRFSSFLYRERKKRDRAGWRDFSIDLDRILSKALSRQSNG